MKFKHITYLLLGGLFAMAQTSCDDLGNDFLTQTNPNELTDDVFWADLDACNTGLTAVYHAYMDTDIMQLNLEARRSDIGVAKDKKTESSSTDEWYKMTWNSSTSTIGARWTALYTLVFNANQVIKGLEGIQGTLTTDEQRSEYTLIMAQARFFRGLAHYYLHSTYNNGNVPIMNFVPTTEAEYYRPCNQADDVKEFFREDLEYARENLPVKGLAGDWGSNDKARVRSAAASATLGMSYLTDKDYTTAEKYFAEIVDNTSYALDPDDNNFTTLNEFNDESILEINYTFDYNSSESAAYRLYQSVYNKMFTHKNYGGAPSCYPAFWLNRAFIDEPVDTRRPENRVNLRQDDHGDIFYHFDPENAIYETTSGIKTFHTYVIARQYHKADADAGLFNGTPDEASLVDKFTMLDENYMYLMLKTIEVNSDGSAVYPNLYDNKGCYELINSNPAVRVPGPWKGLRDDGVWDIYKDADGSLYRYTTRSLRAKKSHFYCEENEERYYGYTGAGDMQAFGGCSQFRKWCSWDTISNENNNVIVGGSDVNFRVIRLADIYLLYAEALIKGGSDDSHINEALKYVNRVRERAGVVLLGNSTNPLAEFANSTHTYQDQTSIEGPEDFAFDNVVGAYVGEDGLHENSPRTLTYTELYESGETSAITTASQLMNHLMYFERPLELCVEGYSSRFLDLRRWGITKERFQDLGSDENANSFCGSCVYNYETHTYNDMKVWVHAVKYRATGEEPYYFQVGSTTVPISGLKDTQFRTPGSMYDTELHDYLPIPDDETNANPNIRYIVDKEGNIVE